MFVPIINFQIKIKYILMCFFFQALIEPIAEIY